MYRKKMMSAVAALALLTTGAMAFDSKIDGKITVQAAEDLAGYTDGTVAANALELSASQKGDALIFPAFKSKDGWETEVVFRNTTNKATIAKVVYYAKDDSRELLDFNVYLSPYDVFRFNTKNNVVSTKDGSVVKSATFPNQGAANDGLSVMNTHGELFTIDETKLDLLSEQEGYIVVYAMAQYTVDGAYHKLHKDLFLDYRALLDQCRGDNVNTPGVEDSWRSAYNPGGIKNGAITQKNTYAPNVALGCSQVNAKGGNFTDPAEDTLVGTVRLSNAAGARDLLLPATALKNFTDGNMVLWSEGEYASIQDRNIDVNGMYVPASILEDAQTFVVKSAYYTYTADSEANTLLITQPMKRILVQLAQGNAYWSNYASYSFGGFKTVSSIVDEDETADNAPTTDIALGNLVSPYTIDAATPVVLTYNDELQAISNIEENTINKDHFTTNDGFAVVTFSADGSQFNGLPAIVTQMIGTNVNGVALTNWVYSPVNK